MSILFTKTQAGQPWVRRRCADGALTVRRRCADGALTGFSAVPPRFPPYDIKNFYPPSSPPRKSMIFADFGEAQP